MYVERMAGLLALLSVACGQTGGEPAGASGSAGAGGSGGSGHDFTSTSYEVRLTQVSYAPGSQPKPVDITVRLDFRAEASGYTALAAYSGTDPDVFAANLDRDRMVLTGEVATSGDGMPMIWKTITIQRAASGKLDGPVEALGEEVRNMGGSIYTYPLVATGSIGPDVTPPDYPTDQDSQHGAPYDQLLPWDPIKLNFSEPVDAAGLAAKVHVIETSTGQSQPVFWRYSPAAGEPTGWAGTMHAKGWPQAWPDTVTSMTLRVDAGISDRAGLLAPPSETSFTVASVAAAPGRNDFSETSPAVTTWSDVQRLNGDARCEQDGCILIGPFDDGFCPIQAGGIAGRVVTSAASLSVRYRVLIGYETTAATLPDGIVLPGFGIDTVRPGEEIATTIVRPGAAELEPLSEPQGKLRSSTRWTTVTIATPAAGDTGFAVHANWECTTPMPFMQPVPPKVPMAIMIDWVGG